MERSVVDDGVVVGRDAQVGGSAAVTLLGLRREVSAGATVQPGDRHPELPED